MSFFLKNKISLFDLLFFSFLSLLLLGFNNFISLWDQDEAAYAGFAKRMLETGHYIIPDFTWSDIHRKPPLHFWLIALSYKIFGVNTFAVRFFSAFAVWLSVCLVRWKGKKIIGDPASKRAALFMAGNVFLMMLGKMAVTDGLLLFFYTWAGLSLTEYLLNGRKKALTEFYPAFALGMLVKGPPMLLWAGFLWLLLLIFYPEKRKVIQMRPWVWGILGLFPFALWIYLAWKQNPDFVRWWTDWYILKRTHSAVLGQTGPPGTYLVLFFVFGAAYLPLVWMTLKYIWKNLKNRNKTVRILILWFVSGWLAYEFLPSKLPAYVLAAYPAMMLLFGMASRDLMKKNGIFSLKWSFGFQSVVFSLITIGIAVVLMIRPVEFSEVLSFPLAIMLLLALGVVLLTYRAYGKWKAGRYDDSVSTLLISGLLWTGGLYLLVLPLAEPVKNATFRVAKTLYTVQEKPEKIVVLNHFSHPPSLIFYLERFFPGVELVIPDPETFFKEDFVLKPGHMYIVSGKQWERIAEKQNTGNFSAVHIKGLATGSVGKNDYVILFPR